MMHGIVAGVRGGAGGFGGRISGEKPAASFGATKSFQQAIRAQFAPDKMGITRLRLAIYHLLPNFGVPVN